MKIKIEKLVYGGDGLGEIDGKKIFVPYSAPGDILEIEIVEDYDGFSDARIVSIEDPAPCRVKPRCPVFGSCGGCQWQHINYGTQLEWKQKIFIETLERIGKISNPEVGGILRSPKEWHYRNRIQLHIDSKKRVGFYKSKSKEVVEFEECFIADERINLELNKGREEFAKRDRGIALRVENSGGSFVQINSAQNEQLRKVLIEWLASVPHKAVLELYAGSGNFTFDIAKIVERVVASDIDKKAIEAAKVRQKKERVQNIEFISVPSGRAARRIGDGCDAVLVDPPRTGCADTLAPIVALRPQSIIYISCNPATLARDAGTLAENGYRLERSLPIDMFPQTFHIESLTQFTCS